MDKKGLEKLVSEYKDVLKKNIPSIDSYIKSIKYIQTKTLQKYGYKPKYKVRNNFRLYVQPIEYWTYDDVKEARKVIEFYKKVHFDKNKNVFKYKKPIYPISEKKSFQQYIRRFKNI